MFVKDIQKLITLAPRWGGVWAIFAVRELSVFVTQVWRFMELGRGGWRGRGLKLALLSIYSLRLAS